MGTVCSDGRCEAPAGVEGVLAGIHVDDLSTRRRADLLSLGSERVQMLLNYGTATGQIQHADLRLGGEVLPA